jgi:hypothetical protein
MGASGLTIDGEVRGMKLLRRAGGGQLVVVARNDTTLQVIQPRGR